MIGNPNFPSFLCLSQKPIPLRFPRYDIQCCLVSHQEWIPVASTGMTVREHIQARDELLNQGIRLKDSKDLDTGECTTIWEVKR